MGWSAEKTGQRKIQGPLGIASKFTTEMKTWRKRVFWGLGETKRKTFLKTRFKPWAQACAKFIFLEIWLLGMAMILWVTVIEFPGLMVKLYQLAQPQMIFSIFLLVIWRWQFGWPTGRRILIEFGSARNYYNWGPFFAPRKGRKSCEKGPLPKNGPLVQKRGSLTDFL